ncbi:MAG: hypothetical protein GTN75_06055 [Gemmatimonadetes bacterium]|nr:hypothetical protein [Gemmatimonadota bacterium]
MCLWNGRYRWLGLALLVCTLGAATACQEDDLFLPGVFPNASGFWSGQYRVSGCALSGSNDPFFCDEVFFNGASLILELELDQSGGQLSGWIYQGELVGDVAGVVDQDGVVTLDGVIGGLGDDFITTILAWQAGLLGDTLLGSWRFWVEDNAGQGFGAATVDAWLTLYGPSVVKFFGCAAEGELGTDAQLSDGLDGTDCQLATGMYVEGMEDGASFDVYTFTGAAGDSIEITLRSEDFDAFMLVAYTDEEVFWWDDDSGVGTSGTDAAFTLVFDVSETVLLIASSYWAGETGAYTLGAELLEPPPTAVRTAPAAREPGGRVRALGGRVGKQGRQDEGAAESPGRRFRRLAGRARGPTE